MLDGCDRPERMLFVLTQEHVMNLSVLVLVLTRTHLTGTADGVCQACCQSRPFCYR